MDMYDSDSEILQDVEIMDMYDSDLEILQDSEFDIPATRFVQIKGEGLENAVIDTGFDAVIKIWDMAVEKNVSYAESIKLEWCANCDIVFKGNNLLLFLKEYYPDKVQYFAEKVNPDSEYTLMSLDFS